jgi:hypothetical protein
MLDASNLARLCYTHVACRMTSYLLGACSFVDSPPGVPAFDVLLPARDLLLASDRRLAQLLFPLEHSYDMTQCIYAQFC